ncbi:hypothetical protein EJB05_54642, partial [Eragrostis curvula]
LANPAQPIRTASQRVAGERQLGKTANGSGRDLHSPPRRRPWNPRGLCTPASRASRRRAVPICSVGPACLPASSGHQPRREEETRVGHSKLDFIRSHEESVRSNGPRPKKRGE